MKCFWKKILISLALLFAFPVFAQEVYQGPVYNIFFHPLIVYPERAFYPSNQHLSYIDNWFVTKNEFERILKDLYVKGFILVSPKDVFKKVKNDGGEWVITKNKLILPAGKKPLILSLDDYNFYNTMKQNGTINAFWVDQQGKLAVIVNEKNKQVVRYNQEIPQILENFVAKHPDFSFKQARGIVALTGYNGIFGYQTNRSATADYQSQLQEAKKVVNVLKNMGWEFASHSYFHKNIHQQSKDVFEQSEKRWLKEVGSLVGNSSYYIFPFGDPWDENKSRMKFLKSLGYEYFFGVSSINETYIRPDQVVMNRFPMDGNSLKRIRLVRMYVNDPVEIMEPSRPGRICAR